MNPTENTVLLVNTWKPYAHLWHRERVAARTLLLRPGAVSDKCYRIHKGAIRMWFDFEDKDISFRFCFEGDIVCDFESFHKGTKSGAGLETLEPSVISWIHKTDFDRVTAEQPVLYKYMLDWALERQSGYMAHFLSLLHDKPQDRYQQLLTRQPQILQRVPLQYIASYLGITPVSLSRIRNKYLKS